MKKRYEGLEANTRYGGTAPTDDGPVEVDFRSDGKGVHETGSEREQFVLENVLGIVGTEVEEKPAASSSKKEG